jgi:small subunit ribosomal protein S5
MAEEETVNEVKDMVEVTPEELEKLETEEISVEDRVAKAESKGEIVKHEKDMSISERKLLREKKDREETLSSWVPKTNIGRNVKAGKEKDIDEILEKGKKILEPEIVDTLLKLETDLISIGQAKGKFGGGKRRAWRQTQKKTMEGNVLTFSAMAVVGDKKGHVGLGFGKAKETLPSREKAIRKAKLNIIKIRRGCAHFDCSCNALHTVPYEVEGKCGSIRIKLIPAPQGTGLVVGDECKKILRFAGIEDVYSFSKGKIRTTFNLAKACIDALEKTNKLELKR